MKELVSTLNLSREEWLEYRRAGIGGSDAAAIAGLHRWKSPLQVWQEKMGLTLDQEENERMYWGTRLEEVVAEEFERRTGKKVRRRNAILQHDEHLHMLANVDRLVVGEKAGLECKTAGEWSGKRLEEEGFLPEHLLQCQHYLAVTGYDKWYLACLIGGQRFVYQEILPDAELIANLIKIEADFWKLVQQGTPPPPDGTDACTRFLSERYPESSPGLEIALPEDAEDLIKQVRAEKEIIEQHEERKAEAENKLKNYLGEAERGGCGKWVVSWKNVASTRIDTKLLKAKAPDTYAQFAKESISRRFEIKEAKVS